MTEEIERASARSAEPCLPPNLRKPRLRRAEASDYLRLAHGIEIKPSTLAKYATVGGGPSYNKCGASPLYPTDELDRWAAERLGTLRASTSDGGAQ